MCRNSAGSFSSYVNGGGALANSRINPRPQNEVLVSSLDSTMTHQELSFDWAHDSAGSTSATTFNNNPHHDLQFSEIKRELSSDSYSKKFSELINSPSSSTIEEDMQNKEHTTDINDMNHVKLLLRTLSSSGGHHHHHQNSTNSGLQDFYSTSSTSSPPPPDPINPPHHRGTSSTFSQIYPTINISSNFNNHQTSSSSLPNSSSTTTFDMNLQALDLFQYSAARFGGASTTTLRQPFMQDQLDLSSRRSGGLSYGLHDDNYMQRPLTSTNMTVLPFSSGGVAAETKRSDDVLLLETKAPANKRSRLESRASCTPFKVRKEKLGDRIAALQQLVAPFGKTDTASVLMEAIGYIKFLQNQVETLSVPYLKSSRNKTHHQRAVQVGTINEERKRDLRSRGLCLVPLSCLSYMTESGGAVWPPPNFGGGT